RDNGSRRGEGTQTAARARWPIARFRLGEEPPEDLSQVTTHTERIAMMWFLAETAWKVAGWPWPRYERRTIPARLFRPGTPPPDGRRCHGGGGPADTPPARNPPRADARTARRLPRARGVGRIPLGHRGHDLRSLRVRHRLVHGGGRSPPRAIGLLHVVRAGW